MIKSVLNINKCISGNAVESSGYKDLPEYNVYGNFYLQLNNLKAESEGV